MCNCVLMYNILIRNILIQVLNKILNKTAIGCNLLEEYEVNDTLKPESRHTLVGLIVEYIQKQHR